VYDEAQSTAQHNIDHITMRFKLDQAMRMHRRLVFKQFFKDWKIGILKESKLNKHLINKLQRKFRVFFKYWRWMSASKHTKRQRELLAEVMGCYSIKSRAFARIKLFIYQNKKVCCSYTLTLTHSLTHILTYSLLLALTHLLTYTYSLTHSLTHLLTDLLASFFR
jgi:hypothetical protein